MDSPNPESTAVARPDLVIEQVAPSFRHSICIIGLLLSLVSGFRASAHLASTAYLQLVLSNQTVLGQLELSLRDLDDQLGLDTDNDGRLSWGELRRREADVVGLVRRHVRVGGTNSAWPLNLTDLQVDERNGEGYAVLRLAATAPAGERSGQIQYRLFFDQDPLHRCLVALTSLAPSDSLTRGTETAVFSPSRVTLPVQFSESPRPASLGTFIREGTHHIWTGYDHLLFLLALLLPAVVCRTDRGWAPASNFRVALADVLKVVTAFTVAHSLTLALAAFGVVRLPSRWVESTIAASIIVAALANLWPMGGRTGSLGLGESKIRSRWFVPWKVAFAFGLIHGFGFAGVLGELGLQRSQLAVPLFGFNAGVELGQLACVAVFLPLAFLLRSTAFYRRGALPVGSLAIILLAGGWLVERAFNLGFMPI